MSATEETKAETLSDDELLALRQSFAEKSNDDDGLDRTAFKELIASILADGSDDSKPPSENDLITAFDLADTNKSGFVDEKEFLGLYSMIKKGDVHGLAKQGTFFTSAIKKKKDSFKEHLESEKAEAEALAAAQAKTKRGSFSKPKKKTPAAISVLAPCPSIQHKTVVDLLSMTVRVYDAFEKGACDADKKEKDALQALSQAEKLGGSATKYVAHSDTTGNIQGAVFLNTKEKQIKVVLRSTEAPLDWMTKTTGVLSKTHMHDDVSVNTGFFDQLQDNKDSAGSHAYHELAEAALKLQNKNPRCRMLIVGHSIGGALATLFGYRISRGAGVTTVNTNIESKVSNNHVTVVSFGSPRVGNTGFQRHFDSQPNLDHLRITNGRDPITALPNLGYQHVGCNLFLDASTSSGPREEGEEGGRASIGSAILFDGSSGAKYAKWWKYSLLRCWKISDHDAAAYLSSLENAKWEGQLASTMAGDIAAKMEGEGSSV